MAWQKRHEYGKRSLAETAVFRIKKLNGGKLSARTFGAQQNEVAIQIAALNKMIRAAKPITIRVS